MIQRMIRRTALAIPQLRNLVDARDAALASRDLATSGQKAAEAALAVAASQQIELFHRLLIACAPDCWLQLELNGVDLWLPRNTLLTMFHCIHFGGGKLYLAVEERHLNWMMQQLKNGGTFLDVGAATGATTLPIVRRFGDSVRIVSYEPAETARNLLLATLRQNLISGVEVRSFAVADAPGTAEFREFLPDDAGNIPYLPETSTLIGSVISDRPHRTLTVPVVTLDEDAFPLCNRKPVVIKIDVEGFETKVLRGAQRLIAKFRPWLSIDIHAEPFGDGSETTERSVRDLLGQYHYHFNKMDHVLLCAPLPDPSGSEHPHHS
jgi:FkbM family methyltransferase